MGKLEMKNLTKTFNPGTVNEKTALSGLSLTVEDGDFITIVGSNGAGKSTLFHAIAGVFYVDGGSIVLDGEDITYKPEYRRSREMGRLFQDPMRGTAPHMTIEENLALAYLRTAKHQNAFFSRTSKADRAFFRDQLARLDMGLEDRMRQPVGLLSGGQRQRVGIAMAMTFQPKLLLADEPTSALDVTTQAQIVRQMLELRDTYGTAILLVTHNLAVAAYMASRILVMRNGSTVEQGDRESLLRSQEPYTRQLLQAVPDLGGKRYV